MRGKIIQSAIIAFVALMALLALYQVKPFSLGGFASNDKQALSPTFQIDAPAGKPIVIGFIGEGGDGHDGSEPADTNALQHLITSLDKNGAKAVFLNGNIVSGIDVGEDGKEHVISLTDLEKRLESVVKAIKEVAPEGMALYPSVGDTQRSVKGSAEVFKSIFHLDGAESGSEGLSYTISMGPALFIVVPTSRMDGSKEDIDKAFSSSMVSWLSQTLAKASKHYRYKFVVGYEPAFPSSTTFQAKNVSKRDEFWKVLSQNGVLAYFSSKEHLFDRSNRNGVWQVISGGSGAPEGSAKSKYPFIHALLLTLPNGEEDDKGIPTLKILDENGEIVDTFELKPQSEPLYQMRIS